jgi:hypothetical protein
VNLEERASYRGLLGVIAPDLPHGVTPKEWIEMDSPASHVSAQLFEAERHEVAFAKTEHAISSTEMGVRRGRRPK